MILNSAFPILKSATRRLNFWQQPLPEGSRRIQLHLEGQGDFALNHHCHRQVSRHLDIPAKY
jgi:hypothetical protein